MSKKWFYIWQSSFMDKPVSRFFNSGDQLWIVCPCMQGVWGGCAPSAGTKVSEGVVPLQKLENCVFLKQNRGIWWIFLGANLIRWWKQNSSFTGSTQPTPIACYGRTGAQITQAIPLVKHCREYIPILLCLWFCTSRLCSKQMPSLPEAVQVEAS